MNSAQTSDLAAKDAAHTPGQFDIWVLVMIEAITFSSYFVVYALDYRANAEFYLRNQAELNLHLGIGNTLVLLTSSWAMARCVKQARAGDHASALRFLWLTVAGGLTFAGMKIYEWSLEMGRGFYFETNDFFAYYYFLTGLHLLHVVAGLIALGVVYYQLSSPRRQSQEIVETGATFWHMVDFLWVIIFTLLYVMR